MPTSGTTPLGASGDSPLGTWDRLSRSNVSFGTLNTTPMLGTELGQGVTAAQVYTNYFGQLPFSHIKLPAYHFEGEVTENGNVTNLHFKLIQSGVSPAFKMLVPIYLEYADGKVTRLGTIPITGSSTFERTLPLSKLPSPVKRVSIDYYYDVLATDD